MFIIVLPENFASFNFKLSAWKSFVDFSVWKETNVDVTKLVLLIKWINLFMIEFMFQEKYEWFFRKNNSQVPLN